MSCRIIVEDLAFTKQSDTEWVARTGFADMFGACYYMISVEDGEYVATFNVDGAIGTFEMFDDAVSMCNAHFRDMLYPIVQQHCHVDEED